MGQQRLFVELEKHGWHLGQPQRLRYKAHIRVYPFRGSILPGARSERLPISNFHSLLLQMLGQTQDSRRLAAERFGRTD
jgi:hypothetical protein